MAYVALLRGINVGGHRPLKMADLRELCRGLGLDAVETYIQSGNVVFEAAGGDERTIATELEGAIRDEFDYDVPVLVLAGDAFDAVVANAPFEGAETDGDEKRYVAFLGGPPDDDAARAFEASGDDAETYLVTGRAAYAVVRREPGERRRFSNALVEKELDTSATTRNWSVVTELASMLDSRRTESP